MNIIRALEDPILFAPFFEGTSWDNWKIFLKAVFCLPMTPQELKVYRKFTGRRQPPKKQPSEVFNIVGMGGGKTRISATVAVFLAAFRDYSVRLAPGQRIFVYLIAADKDQAREAFRYALGLFENIGMLAQLVERKTANTIDLINRVTLEVRSANFRSIRGRSLAAVVADEVAFWRSEESSNPDKEILDAVRPGLGRVAGSILVCISSPYSRRGELYGAFKKHYGNDASPTLVWKATTSEMNPSFDPQVIQQRYEDDPIAAASQYGGEFRSDIASFVDPLTVDAATTETRMRLTGIFYVGFFDAAGGSGRDSMASAVAHREGQLIIVDAVMETRPPFSPTSAIAEHAAFLKSYGVRTVTADRYAGQFPTDALAKHQVTCKPSDLDKSAIYREVLPLFNSRRIQIPENQRLINQLLNLERRTRSGGKDIVDHPQGLNDDLANVCSGAAVLASKGGGYESFANEPNRRCSTGRKRPFADVDPDFGIQGSRPRFNIRVIK